MRYPEGKTNQENLADQRMFPHRDSDRGAFQLKAFPCSYLLGQESVNFFLKGPDNNCLRGPFFLCCNNSSSATKGK